MGSANLDEGRQNTRIRTAMRASRAPPRHSSEMDRFGILPGEAAGRAGCAGREGMIGLADKEPDGRQSLGRAVRTEARSEVRSDGRSAVMIAR